MNKHAFIALVALLVATVMIGMMYAVFYVKALSHGGTTGFEDFMAIYLIAVLIVQVYILNKSD